jgi:hypothetical protein
MSNSPLAAFGAAMLFLAPPAAAVAAPAPKKEVLAEVFADLNGDGVKDRAVLLHAPDGDDVDLAIYLSAAGAAPAKPSLYKTALGWTGAMAGATPELSVNKAGSLVILFQNDSIGRDRWSQQLTIAYRGGALVVAGYDYTSRDTLAPSQGGNCDVNYLSGRATRNGRAVKFSAGSIRLSDWTDKSAPAFCSF